MVEIRPLPRKKWHGKEGQESFTQPVVVEALVNPTTGRYETGLTREQEAKYSKEMGVDLSSLFTGEAHPFWCSKASWVYLPNRTVLLDPQKPQEFLKIQICKASKYVANSMKDWENNLFPDATHVIYDEETEIEVKALKVNQKQEAYALLTKMTDEDKSNVLQIVTGKMFRGKSTNFLNTKVDTEIESNPTEFIRVVKMGREEVGIRAKVLELLFRNILTKEGGAILYMGEVIANDYEDAVKWFKDPNNTKFRITILEKLNAV